MADILQDRDKDALIESLKEKIAELYVTSETLNQQCSASRQRVESSESNLRGHIATMEYYEQRHNDMADATRKLQTELLQSKNESITLSAHMNRLSIENQRITEDLTESRSRLQSDKQMLSNNLERIEREICSNAKSYIKEREDVNYLKCEIDQRLTQIEIMKTDNNNLKLQIAELEDLNTKQNTTISEQEILSTNKQISNGKLKLENENNLSVLEEKISEINSLKDIINKHKTTIGEHESICNSQISLERLKYEIDINATYLDGKLIKTQQYVKEAELFKHQLYKDIEDMGKKFYDNEGFTMQGGRRFKFNKELQETNRKLSEDYEEIKIALENEKKITDGYLNSLNEERSKIKNLNEKILEYENKCEQPNVDKKELSVFNKTLHNENMDYYISTIKNMRSHIEDQEKELLHMKNLNHAQLTNNSKLDSHIRDEQTKLKDLQSVNDANIITIKEINTQLESVMVENNGLTEKISNLLTIQENSMEINSAYEEQLENMFNDKTEAERKINKITYNSQMKIRELEQDNINFKNKIEELTDSKSVFSEKQKHLEEEILEKSEILKTQESINKQFDNYKFHMEESLRQLSEDLAHSDKLNQSLRDINVEHLQMKYNNEQDILVLQQQLEEQHKQLLDYKDIIKEPTNNENREANIDKEIITNEIIEVVEAIKLMVNLNEDETSKLDVPITESYNCTYDNNKLSREILDKNSMITDIILKQKVLLNDFNNSHLIES